MLVFEFRTKYVEFQFYVHILSLNSFSFVVKVSSEFPYYPWLFPAAFTKLITL